MLADRLTRAWRERRRSTDIDPVMRFTDAGLTFGAGTVLAPAGRVRGSVSIDPEDCRLEALLTAAHMRRPADDSLAHLCKAAERWSEGDYPLSTMHLVLSRLDRLEQPIADAQRLFLADRLLQDGVEASVIIETIEAEAAALKRVRKFNPDEPRVPAGNGRPSGQWTSGGSTAATPELEGEVNPRTVSPAADHKANSDTGRIAALDCIRHVVEDSRGMHANANWREEWVIACDKMEEAYNKAEYLVETNPHVTGGIVGYPDGGLIILRKGKDDVYIPARRPRFNFPPH